MELLSFHENKQQVVQDFAVVYNKYFDSSYMNAYLFSLASIASSEEKRSNSESNWFVREMYEGMALVLVTSLMGTLDRHKTRGGNRDREQEDTGC